MLYECGSFYVGKTKVEIWLRMTKHVWSTKGCNPDFPLGRHVTDLHNGIFSGVKLMVLDRIHPSARGGDWYKILLQRELKLIFLLQATIFLKKMA